MHARDFTFPSANTAEYPKPITARAVEPDHMDAATGLLHCCHGWSGNRFQYIELMEDFANRYNLVCVSTEFRQSGYDFDTRTGLGAETPYDGSHYQVVDCLNAVREALRLYPGLDRGRLLLFGGSQGGHISMLMSIFAPDTFACVLSGSGISRFDGERIRWCGRHFTPDELAIRDVARMAGRVKCPVALHHGTADTTVPAGHTRDLEAALRAAGNVELRVKYIEGGEHSLEPVTDRKTVAIEMADDLLRGARHPGMDDFMAKRTVTIPCVDRALVLDWKRDTGDANLMRWR